MPTALVVPRNATGWRAHPATLAPGVDLVLLLRHGQVNEDEMRLLGDDALAVAAEAIGRGVSLLNVTLGPRGAAYVARPGFQGITDLRTRTQSADPLRFSARLPTQPSAPSWWQRPRRCD